MKPGWIILALSLLPNLAWAQVPLPGTKPAAPQSGTEVAAAVSNPNRYQPKFLFEGGLGDRALGEGVVVIGRRSGPPLTLNAIAALGLEGASSLDIPSQQQFTGVGTITDESQSARLERDKRAAASALLERDAPDSYEVVVLRALDKITGRLSTLKVPVEEDGRFGALEIRPRACQKTPPTEPPEDAAFLEIREVRPNQPTKLAFTGWMFRTRPAISALEHPIYDVWVVGCTTLARASGAN